MEKDASFPNHSEPREQSVSQTIKAVNVKNNDRFEDLIPDNSLSVEIGTIVDLSETNSGFLHSFGAGPCVSGLIKDTNGHLKAFHFTPPDNYLFPEQLNFLETAQNGFIGGDQEILKKFQSLFETKNIKTFKFSKPKSFFHFLIDQSNPEIKFYYNYSTVNDDTSGVKRPLIPYSQSDIKAIRSNTDY
ncbi:MAG: hypothetical protein KIH89_001835 [Candidatus Shapirobacteria bacterium]|nr:hypothetical protein [Candidatus Shapirobacteria bacterium]